MLQTTLVFETSSSVPLLIFMLVSLSSRSKPASSMATLFFLLLAAMAHHAGANLDQDRAECATQLVGLSTCLPYVEGEAKAPTVDCCTGLKQVLKQSQKCLCILIKDRNDPNLGLKINGTLAVTLPDTCHAPANVSDCINLLHLSPNSTDAKIFKEFANVNGAKTNSTSATITTGSNNGTDTGAKNSGANGQWTTKSSEPVIFGSLAIVFLHTILF